MRSGQLVFFIYRTLVFFTEPLVLGLGYLFKPLLPAKLVESLEMRRQPAALGELRSPVRADLPLIWVHSASGEFEYAKPVLRRIKQEWPEAQVLATYFSPSYRRAIESCPDVDFSAPLPFDRVDKVESFLYRINPACVLFSRTDVWPELAYQLRSRSIPSLLFSATFAQQSSRLGLLGRQLNGFALNQLSEIHLVTEQDKLNIKALQLNTPQIVSGDTRYDQVIERRQNPRELKDPLRPWETSQVLVAGSTWPEDESVLLESLEHHPYRLILAPHETEPERIAEISQKLNQLELSFDLYSEASNWESRVLVIDVKGILADLYSWGAVAFVGGSFKGKVHSVMEPLAAGLPVFVGPYYDNNREACEWSENFESSDPTQPWVRSIHSGLELAEGLRSFQSKNMIQLRERIQNRVEESSGASERVLNWIRLHISAR